MAGRRRHIYVGGSLLGVAFLVLAVLRFLFGNAIVFRGLAY